MSATPTMATDDLDEATRRRKAKRFALMLLGVVVLLVLATVVYVKLYTGVLRDPDLPPTVASPRNPRVLLFETLLAAAAIVAFTAIVVIRRRRGSR